MGPADDAAERDADRIAEQVTGTLAELRGHAEVRRSAASSRIRRAVGGPSGEPAIGAAGGALPEHVESRIRSRSGGAPLARPVRAEMEQAFGRPLGDVRVHHDADADRLNRSMGALAFTAGRDVYFSAGSYRPGSASGDHLLAHELAHVVQQGPTARRHVVVHRLFGKKKTKAAAAATTGSATAAATTDDAKPADDVDLKDAIAYERALGAYLFNHPVANFAAVAVVDKMISALIKDFDAADATHQQQLAAGFGKGDVHSAGQVGTAFADVWAAMSTGNLRERMTSVYNAAFGAFKTTVLDILQRAAWDEAAEKGLDTKKLKRRKRQLGGNVGAKDLYRDPGNPLDRKNFGSYEKTGTTRTKADQTSGRTVGDLEAGPFSTGLSEREKRLQFGARSGDDLSAEKLSWKEGGTYWAVKHDNKWVKKVAGGLKMPVVAGPSGTALRLWQLWEFLGKPVPAAHWRAAILAWMLSSNDHSFHEMMMVSADYGLPYVKGPAAYRAITPFSEGELRNFAAVERTFPDEWTFVRKIGAGKLNLVTDQATSKADDIAAAKAGLSPGEKAAVTALVAYTDEDPSGYKFMNNASSGGLLGPKFYKFIMEDAHLKPLYKANKFNIKGLLAESKELTGYATSALRTLDPFQGTLWRGFKAFGTGGYAKGKTMTFSKFLSTSKDRDVAEGFADKGMGTKSILIEIDGKTGIDIDDVSLMQGEDEVLFPPGSTFKVTQAPTKATGDDYYVTKWDDVSTAGAKADIATDASGGTTLTNLAWDSAAAKDSFQELLDKAQAPPTATTATVPTAPVAPLDVYLNTNGDLPLPCKDPKNLIVMGPADKPGWTMVFDSVENQGGVAKDDELAVFLGTAPAPTTTAPVTTPPTTVPTTTGSSTTLQCGVVLTATAIADLKGGAPYDQYLSFDVINDMLMAKANAAEDLKTLIDALGVAPNDVGFGLFTAYQKLSKAGAKPTTAPDAAPPVVALVDDASAKPGDGTSTAVTLHCGAVLSPEGIAAMTSSKDLLAHMTTAHVDYLVHAREGAAEDIDTLMRVLGVDKDALGGMLMAAAFAKAT